MGCASVSKEVSKAQSVFFLAEIGVLFGLTEELQKQLVEQMELRKKLEREFQHLKGKNAESRGTT